MRNKRSILIISIIAIITIGGFIQLYPRSAMKLIHKKTGCVIAEQKGDQIYINDPFIEAEIKLKGIAIPSFLSEKFEGKSVVRMGDPLFNKAFKTVYLPFNLKKDAFSWE